MYSGVSKHYTCVTVSTLPSCIESLTPPSQLTVLDISPTSFTVSWRPPLGDLGNGSIIYYLINVIDTEGESVVLLQHMVNDTTLQLRVPQLLPDHVHQVSVAAAAEDIGPARTVWIKTSLLASMYVLKHLMGYGIYASACRINLTICVANSILLLPISLCRTSSPPTQLTVLVWFQ